MSAEKTSKRPPVAVVIAIAITGLFLFSTFREGHNWGGDNYQYFLHAKNLAQGLPFKDIGLVFNPLSAIIPESYPPVFCFMLVPICYLFGTSMVAAKVMILFLFLAVLLFLSSRFKNLLPDRFIVVLILLFGFNPVLWDFKDYVYSEIPFIFFTLSFFWVSERATLKGSTKVYLQGIALGILLYLAYGTRAVGLILWPSLVLSDIFRHKKPSLQSIIALVVFIPLFIVQNVFFHSEIGHALYKSSLFSFDIIVKNLSYTYPFEIYMMWHYSDPVFIVQCLVFALALLALWGFRETWIHFHASSQEIYVVLYLLFFLLISFQDQTPPTRYFLPVVPMLIAYTVVGIHALSIKKSSQVLRRFVYILMVAIPLLFLSAYSKLEMGTFKDGPESPLAQEMYDFVRKNTTENDVVAFIDPRVMIFHTGRKSTQYNLSKTHQEELTYYRKTGVKYWALCLAESSPAPNQAEIIFSNEKYLVYRV